MTLSIQQNYVKGGDKMTLSRQKINVIMARKCWIVSDLAKSYGCSNQRIYAILNTKRVSNATAGKIAAALGVDVTEILED